jgi:hypothetical protein
MRWVNEKTDREYIKAVKDSAVCDRLIRRLKWQRDLCPLLAVAAFLLLGAVAIWNMQQVLKGNYPSDPTVSLFLFSIIFLVGIGFSVAAQFLDIRIKTLLMIRAQQPETK